MSGTIPCNDKIELCWSSSALFLAINRFLGINKQTEALFPHVGTMTFLSFVLLLLLQGSVTTTTIKTTLSHQTFEVRNDCPVERPGDTQSDGPIACGLRASSINFEGFRTTWMEDFAQFLSGLLMVRIHVGDVFLKNRNKMPDEDPR